MSTSASSPQTQQIPVDQWTPFLAEFTQRNRGAHARLEILDGESGYVVETEDRPFDGVAADLKGSTRTLWITFGSVPDDSLAHGAPEPIVLRAVEAQGNLGEILEIESKDGTRTILTLSQPEDFALPAAGFRAQCPSMRR